MSHINVDSRVPSPTSHPLRERLQPFVRRDRRLRLALAALCAGGVLALPIAVAAPSGPASASTLNGIATIAQPGTSTALTSGDSAALFTVSLPAQASCDGDTATDGYHVYSYLVKQGTALSGVTFHTFPSEGFGLVDPTGSYYGPTNTAIGTGQIVSIPNDFEWAPLVADDNVPLSTLLYAGSGASASGVWEAGLLCANSSGEVTDNWNTQVTFFASSSSTQGFAWSTLPGLQISTLSLPDATPGASYGPVQLQTIGDTAGATFKWKKLTALPKGLKLTGSGLLQGTPNAKKVLPGSTLTVSVTVTEKATTFVDTGGKKPTKVKTQTTVSKNLTLHIA